MRNDPAPRSRMAAKMLGESKCGRHSHSIDPSGATSAPVWQSERKAYSPMGGNGEPWEMTAAGAGSASSTAWQANTPRDGPAAL